MILKRKMNNKFVYICKGCGVKHTIHTDKPKSKVKVPVCLKRNCSYRLHKYKLKEG